MSQRQRLYFLRLIRRTLQDWRTARKQIEAEKPQHYAMIHYHSLETTMKEFPLSLWAYFLPEVNRWAKFYYRSN